MTVAPDDSPGGQQRGVDDEVHVDLPNGVQAPGEARRAVRAALLRWRLTGLADAVTLAVSELVTNAVRHGLPPVRLVLSRGKDDVRVDVHDEAAGEPGRHQRADDAAESGRGLAIVDRVASTSGVEQVTDDGKIVFATFERPPEST